MIGFLCAGTGLLSWTVWNQGVNDNPLTLLTAWFAWYVVQTLLSGPLRIRWGIRWLSSSVLLSGLIWQSKLFEQKISQFTLSVQSDIVVEDSRSFLIIGLLFGLSVLLLWCNYTQRKGFIHGLSFIRHSMFLLIGILIVEFLTMQGFDVRQSLEMGLVYWLFAVTTVDLLWVTLKYRTWTIEDGLQTPLLSIFCSRWNPIQSFFDALERLFGIDIQGTWVIRFVRQLLEPLLVLLMLIGWISTTMVQVHPEEQGVRSHFGVTEKDVLNGGLHWKLPYPFGTVDRVSSRRIHQLSIGHEEVEGLDIEEEAPESILWANQHGDEEFLLLLGDGHDVISADGVLEYRISDVHQYLFAAQNPEDVLESVVYQVLMEQTSSRTLEEALSENLSGLAQLVTSEIASRIGQYEIGIEPLLFTFTALHPPVAVAKNYQEVVSAQIDQQTTILRAEQYQLASLPKVRAKALEAVERAKQESTLSLASATGEAISFEALRQTVRTEEALYRFRKRQENLQQSIAGRNIVVLDHRLESQGATLWINP